ncbi:bifunctional hydroxymethylpyrimidine kinase/phosphomethylpyrimidine kinase [Stygiolobus caldivivus]|uniref:Bifunctional hydroxymethylpyrimidine kinase/phosphomethylpyrimidine kinase n=1 Tax=Stygiolobus caldivivus TaxID=2824673 RepID=A0A8D5U4Q1_9CREN|nr:bifunctional hydroxymethylpyrimidine kinase/phosphomethylpyrimidine kinase [Stygiolobus caldivivus]BCU69415.1 bifunctional hydroxymethylpyrimidine kinase/phosphomethylpyrimidine kinase [Stygiolobus caldivivus]
MERRERTVVMTIAGSDSGGGAGLQADLKTFTSLGVFGTTIVTGLTAQNTQGVSKVLEVPLDFIEAQFDTVMRDLHPKYAKTGMLSNSSIVKLVERKVKEYSIKLVLDPVMVAKSGDQLVTEDTVNALKDLMKHSILTTPNKYEAEKLTQLKINNVEDLAKVAKKIYEEYGIDVVVKGGSSLGGLDIAIINGKEVELKGEEIKTENTHGSGDVFSAAITAYLAKGENLETAVRLAKNYVNESIKFSLSIGKGHGPVDPFAPIERTVEKENARLTAEKCLWELENQPELLTTFLDEEDKSNIAVLTDYGDVASLAGGIIRYLDKIKLDGPILVNIDNKVSQIAKKHGKKIVLSLTVSDRLLKKGEEGKIMLTTSGRTGDLILENGRAYLTGNSCEELINKLREMLK